MPSPSCSRISSRRAPRGGRTRWPRSSATARQPRPAPAARRDPGRAARSSGRRRSGPPARSTSGRRGTTTVRPPGQHASASAVAAGAHLADRRQPGPASSRSSTIPLSGGRRFTVEQPLDAARRVERDRDPVDRVGRQRDDAARRAGPRSPPPRPAASSGTTRARHAGTGSVAASAAALGRGSRGLRQPRRGGPNLGRAGQDQRLDHPGDALVGQRRRDVAGRPPGPRPARSASPPRGPTSASISMSFHWSPIASDRARAAPPAGGRASGPPGPSRRRAPRTRGSAGG